MENIEHTAVIAVLVKELDAVRAIAINAWSEAHALRARISELESKVTAKENANGDTPGS